jgi:hypothetical protein
MDRSFLSKESVITASRRLVCVRLATYENASEAVFLKGLLRTGSGEVENTTFCVLAPDGRTKLVRAARGPEHLFADARDMAEALNRVADRYAPRANAGPGPLPTVPTVRLALDVAAADNRPLVVIFAADAAARKSAEAEVAALAWSPEFVGRFAFATAASADDLRAVTGAPAGAAVLVVQPEKFGRSGTVLARCPVDANAAVLAANLRDGAAGFRGEDKAFSDHVQEGQRKRIYWETPVPVTDPMERQARERGRRMAEP